MGAWSLGDGFCVFTCEEGFVRSVFFFLSCGSHLHRTSGVVGGVVKRNVSEMVRSE